MRNTDRTWRRLGRDDPFFGVLTSSENRVGTLDERGTDAFYQTGIDYVGWLRDSLSDFAPELTFANALDFGCGVGRVTIPLGAWLGEATGVDVSEAIVDLARARAAERGRGGVTFHHSSELPTLGRFDLVHSFIVLQHIRPKRALDIIAELLAHVGEHGVAALHLTYRTSFSRGERLRQLAYMNVPGLWDVKNLVTRRAAEPMIQMHLHDLNQVLGLLQDRGFHRVAVRFSRHGEFDGVVVFAERTQQPFV